MLFTLSSKGICIPNYFHDSLATSLVSRVIRCWKCPKNPQEVKHKQEARTPCPKRVRPLSMMCHSNAALHTNEGISSLIEEIKKGVLLVKIHERENCSENRSASRRANRSYHHPLINGWISASFGVIRRAGSKARHLSKRSMKDVKSFISSSFSLIETGGISRDRRSLTGP